MMAVLRLVERIRPHSGRAVWAAADQGINPLLQLILTPFLLKALGRDAFGVWMLGATIISMSQLVSLGAGIAATRHVSADLGARNFVQAVANLRAALAVAMLGGAIASVAFLALAPVLASALFSNMGPQQTVAPVLALCGIAAAVQEVDNVFVGAMRAAERFDLCARSEVPARIAMACVLLLVSSCGVHVLMISMIGMMVVKATLKGVQVALLFGTGACCWPSLSTVPLQRVAHFGFWQWLQSGGTLFFSAADQLLVGGLLGAGALARYSVCLQVGQYVHLVPSVLMQIVFPRISALGPKLDPVRGNEILRSATLVALCVATSLAVPIIVFARPILAIWIGTDFAAANQWLLIVLVAVHVTLAFNIAPYFVLLGSGRARRSALIVLAAGAAQFAVALVAAPYGVLMLACSRFVYSLLTAFLYKAALYDTRVG